MFQLRDSILTLVDRLSGALDEAGISYCQWKGHWKRDRWATGEGDIDLLVDRTHVERFAGVLCRLGFKQALTPLERQIPGVATYYGFDPDVNRFINIHVHYQLLFGHYLTMNYHLPIERPILESAVGGRSFRTPTPEFELIVFVIRMILAFSPLASIRHRQAAWSLAAQDELTYLRARANPIKATELLQQQLPFIGAAFFKTCMLSLRSDCSVWTRLNLKQRMHSKLKSHTRRSQLSDFLWRVWCWIINKVWHFRFRRPARNKLVSGGKIIALIGGDGAGKSTAVDELYRWLSTSFDTMTFHLGKPPRSLMTLMVAVARRGGLLLVRLLNKTRKIFALAEGKAQSFPAYLLLLRSVCIARDRYRLYVKARRFAMKGGLVICDRYPMPQIRSMDGPNISRLIGSRQSNQLTDILLMTEAKYYQQIIAADLSIVLRVDPEIAVRRKTDEDADYVRSRSLEVWELDLTQSGALVVDADRPKDDVLSDLQSIIWSEL